MGDKMANKLVLVDGNSLFYRAFYALPPLQNENGEYTNAIYGFCNILTKIITDFKPTHLVVAFDAGKHTFRNDLYAEYKATRKPMPPELVSQAKPLRELLALMGIKVIEKPGVEADDILGTVAHRFLDDTIIVTGDRDIFQLIDDNTHVFFTKKGISDVQVIDEAEFKKQYGFKPINIVDLKALQGDASDNIPGAKGVGEKTAKDLIQKYTTIENVYAHIDEIKGKLQEKLVDSKPMVELSKTLATINDKVDLGCELEECTFAFPFGQEVFDAMTKYNFKSITKRVELFDSVDKTMVLKQFETKEIDCVETLDYVIDNIKNKKQFAFVIAEDFHISTGETEFVLKTENTLLGGLVSTELFFEKLKPVFEDINIMKIVFDYKTVLHFLDKLSISVFGKVFDVAIAKHLVDGISVKDIESSLNSFNVEDCFCSCALCEMKQKYESSIEELGMHKLFYDVEMPLAFVLFSMEKQGFMVDQERLKELGEIYSTEIEILKEKIIELAGESFNIDSPKQLGGILFDKLMLSHDKKKSTDIDQLLAIENEHEIVPLIIRYRKLAKLNNTYIKGIAERIDVDGKIRTSFKQTLTTTGRLSSTDPNLQNLPIRTEESREIRSMFVASSKDNVLIDVDYSQIELRVLAHMSGDEIFSDAFKTGEDVHTSTACGVFGVEPEQVTKEMRRTAKIVNFGVIYGISEYGLAKDIGVSPKDAKRYIQNFYYNHPKVDLFMKQAVQTARETGRVGSLLNRSRKMLDIGASNAMVRMRAERASQNMRLQGSAADIIKLAMVSVFEKLKTTNAKMIMQVHDELVIDCPKKEQEKVLKIVKDCMENAIKLNVPLTVDASVAYRWSEGH